MNDSVTEVVSETPVPESPAPTPKINRWWQWFLIYPTLAISLMGAIPTVIKAIESWQLGVPISRVDDAKVQASLWQINFDCVQKTIFTSVTTEEGVQISSAVCNTGDVLLRGKRPGWQQFQYRWVAWSDVAVLTSGKTDIGSNAFHDSENALQPHTTNALWVSDTHHEQPRLIPIQFGSGIVMCQVFIGDGILRQRIQTPQGCFDRVINTYTGWVLGTYPAPCSC